MKVARQAIIKSLLTVKKTPTHVEVGAAESDGIAHQVPERVPVFRDRSFCPDTLFVPS